MDISFVISDSEEDIYEDKEKEQVFVIESSGSSVNTSPTPEKSRFPLSEKSSLTEETIRQRIRKHMPSYFDNENTNDHNEDDFVSISSSEECNTDDNISNDDIKQVTKHNGKIIKRNKWQNISKENKDDFQIASPSTSKSGSNNSSSINEHTFEERIKHQKSNSSTDTNSHRDEEESDWESEVAVSLAKEEIGVGNIDPLIAQKRALLVCKMEQLQNQLSKTKLLFTTGNIDSLPDKGAKLRECIAMQEMQIEEIAVKLENTPLTETQTDKTEAYFVKEEISSMKEGFTVEEESHADKFDTCYDVDGISIKPRSSREAKELGKMAQATFDKELALTVDRLQDLHGSLVARPAEDEKAEDPKGLKVKLMPHQQHALAWLIWREQQRPPGGVLADDMGLGKTLTMISLIVASIAKMKLKEMEDCSDDEWMDNDKPLRHKGGTLVACPASLLSQWEKEINQRCKCGMLTVEVYHGINREHVPKRLARKDVVITTYNILSREFKSNSTLYKIHWERVILDEAHIIRNHKSQACQAVCGLLARKRWALTGTPIQNSELDLYSVLKFLKCSPFDDLRVWKRWVDNKNAAGCQRLATVMKTLMLRRTKQELQVNGRLESLPEKFIEEIFVKLDSQEQLIYEKVLVYSRTLFAQFLAQRAEKDHMVDLNSGRYDKPSFLSNPNKNTQFTKAQNKLLSLHADVKAHEILVLLLRLRQICVHPSLIHSMLDQNVMKETEIMETENVDLVSQIGNITLEDSENNVEENNEEEIGVDRRVATNLLTSKNSVFKPDRISSKLKMVFHKVEEILQQNDKMIIVSQWTSTLHIIASYLSLIHGATFSMFTGNVPIKDRQGVMDSFNTPNSDPKILLLSLTAGGVGLNLVGANHLLLIDVHWNPQLEEQAQDRIYRFGQRKNVFIYKFICKDTIEERIKQLQERKLNIAQNVLSGDKNSTVSKLTLNDLKSLFAL